LTKFSASERYPTVAQLSKAPILGSVKTRMQPTLSQRQSIQLHCWLTERCVANTSQSDGWQHQLWVDKHDPFFDSIRAEFTTTLCTQCSGDLGARLEDISQHYAGSPSVLIGSDCPFITEELITQVFSKLSADNELVLIPADDGGYVGLATIQHYPELFQNIDWGTERVAEQTLQRASELGLKTRCFASLPDIDRPEDLSLLKGETIGSDVGLDLDSNRVP